METLCFRLEFKTPVHFGEGRLGDYHFTFDNQRLFSALYSELIRHDKFKADYFYKLCLDGKIVFSDAFPYIDSTLYLPRPLINAHFEGERKEIKALKNLSFIPVNSFEDYLNGRINPLKEKNKLSKLGVSSRNQRVNLQGEQPEPYFVGSYSFESGSGLYFLFSYKNEEDYYFFDDAMTLLGYSGIGGKRTSGFGRFDAYGYDIEEKSFLSKRINKSGPKQMSLGFSVPADNEWDCMEEGSYKIIKKSGFIHSEELTNPIKRKRVHGIKSGSVFNRSFSGTILDVGRNISHPVYLYAKPMWMEV